MNKHYVLVYGSLRKGMGNHRILQRGGAEYIKDCEVYGYTMISFGAFPALVPTGVDSDAIIAEMYAVDDATFANLDVLEGYPNFYDRCMVDDYPDPAWIYFIDNKELLNNQIVSNGDWCKYKEQVA